MDSQKHVVWRLHGYIEQVACVRARTDEGWTLTVCYRDDPMWTEAVEDVETATERAERMRQALLVQGFFDAEPS